MRTGAAPSGREPRRPLLLFCLLCAAATAQPAAAQSSSVGAQVQAFMESVNTPAYAVPTPGVKLEAFRFFYDLYALPDVLSATPDLVTTMPAVDVQQQESAVWPALAAFSAPGQPRFDGANYTRNWAARITGQLDISVPGIWHFFLASAEGGRLHLGGRLLLGTPRVGPAGGPGGFARRGGFVALDAGLHSLAIDYYMGTGNTSGLLLEYMGPGMSAPVTVPPEALYLPQGECGLCQCGNRGAKAVPGGRVLCVGHAMQAPAAAATPDAFSSGTFPADGVRPAAVGCAGDVCAGPPPDPQASNPFFNSSDSNPLLGYAPPFQPITAGP